MESLKEYNCPLLERIIDEGYCYDINLVANKIAKEDILDDAIDRDKANILCNKCPNKAL